MESQIIEKSIFADEANLVVATGGQRFANYLIDLASFYVILFVVLGSMAAVMPGIFDIFDSPGGNALDRLMTLVLYGVYMGAVEAVFQGRSLGKLITGTKAVNEDGSDISGGKAFLRGLSRAVPFNPFSALGATSHPWHDRWTDTLVVDLKKSSIPSGK